jgi:hypothetical protein
VFVHLIVASSVSSDVLYEPNNWKAVPVKYR